MADVAGGGGISVAPGGNPVDIPRDPSPAHRDVWKGSVEPNGGTCCIEETLRG